MKSLKLFLLSLILLLSISTGVKAEYLSDIIVTSPNGIWTDSRTFATLNAAITAVGASQRTVVIAKSQVVTALTVPSNVTLKFERDGSITNSGQLTINTTNIIADNHQVFTGTGDIDFTSGSVVKLSWFSNLLTALTVTSDDHITMIVNKAITASSSYALGNDVILRWEAPSNIITANVGVTISNIGQVEAGNYQILAGAGNFRFRDGTELNLTWLPMLRTALTWIDTNKVSLVVNTSSPVDYSDSIPSNINVRIKKGGDLAITGGITLTIASTKQIDIGPYYFDPFTDTGSVAITGGSTYTPATTLTASVLGSLSSLSYEIDALGYSPSTFTQATIVAALTAIGTTNKVTLLLRPGNWVITTALAFPANVTVKMPAGAYFSGAAVTAGTITGLRYATPDMFGVNTTPGTTDMTVAIQAAILSVGSQGEVHIKGANVVTASLTLGDATSGNNSLARNVWIHGDGVKTQLINRATAGKPTFDMTHQSFWKLSDMILSGESTTPNNGVKCKTAGYNWSIERVYFYMAGEGIHIEDTNTGMIRDCKSWPNNSVTFLNSLPVPPVVTASDISHHIRLTGGYAHAITIENFVGLVDNGFAASFAGIYCDATDAFNLRIKGGVLEGGAGTTKHAAYIKNAVGLVLEGLYHESAKVELYKCSFGSVIGLTDGNVGGTLLVDGASSYMSLTGNNVHTITLDATATSTTMKGNYSVVLTPGWGASTIFINDYLGGTNFTGSNQFASLYSLKGNISSTNAAQTLFAVTTGLWIVGIGEASGGQAAYTSMVFVLHNGSELRLMNADNGSAVTFSLSGANLQVAVTGAEAKALYWTAVKMTLI